MDWYYCLAHQAVEEGLGCPNSERMGPYATEQEAATAMERAHQHSEEFDAED